MVKASLCLVEVVSLKLKRTMICHLGQIHMPLHGESQPKLIPTWRWRDETAFITLSLNRAYMSTYTHTSTHTNTYLLEIATQEQEVYALESSQIQEPAELCTEFQPILSL